MGLSENAFYKVSTTPPARGLISAHFNCSPAAQTGAVAGAIAILFDIPLLFILGPGAGDMLILAAGGLAIAAGMTEVNSSSVVVACPSEMCIRT
jgi:hypothetical protein